MSTNGQSVGMETDELTFQEKADRLATLRTELYGVNRDYLIECCMRRRREGQASGEWVELPGAKPPSQRAELVEEVGDLMDSLEVERAAFLDDLRQRVQGDVLVYFRSLGYGSAGLPATTGEGLDLILTGLARIANVAERRMVPEPPDTDIDTEQRKLNDLREGIALTHTELARYRDNPDAFTYGEGYSRVQRQSPEQAEAQRRRVLIPGDDERPFG